MTTKITKYRTYKDEKTGRITCVQPYIDDWLPRIIPISDDNVDYQAYRAWVAGGNTAEEAD